MSIVYDYLKQIQGQGGGKPLPPLPEKPSVPSRMIVMASAFLVCLLIFFAFGMLKKSNPAVMKTYPPRDLQRTASAFPAVPVLGGIIYNPAKSFAIINGTMFEVGGKTRDFEVLEITPDTVSLRNLKDQSSSTLRL